MSGSINKRGQHWPDCRCILCLSFSRTCGECGREFTTYPSFRSHEAAHARKRVKDSLSQRSQTEKIASRKRVVVPDYLGYLQTVVTDRDGLAAYNLGAISRFAAVINELRTVRKRFSKGHKLLLKRLTQPDAPAFCGLSCEIPKDQAISVMQLALACGVSPNDVLALLVSYGLEHLGQELRSGKPAPAPVAPADVTPRVRKMPVSRSPHEEFVDENFPEASSPKKVIEIHEYRKPAPDKTRILGAIPNRASEDEGAI